MMQLCFVFFFKQKTAYEMRISDWSSDVCSSDLLDGLERIRYTTSHPADMDEALIAAHGEVGKLMPYLHLPVQSGSDRVLKAMNRSHTVESYLKLLERFRAARPDIALSGDFIVGFPGESEAEFEERSEEHTSELQSLMRISYAV